MRYLPWFVIRRDFARVQYVEHLLPRFGRFHVRYRKRQVIESKRTFRLAGAVALQAMCLQQDPMLFRNGTAWSLHGTDGRNPQRYAGDGRE